MRAYTAQNILWILDIDLDDEINLVWVKKAIHKALHINAYFVWVNREIGESFYIPYLAHQDFTVIETSVKNKLTIMKAKIYSLNLLL
jgi:hypothetical protein